MCLGIFHDLLCIVHGHQFIPLVPVIIYTIFPFCTSMVRPIPTASAGASIDAARVEAAGVRAVKACGERMGCVFRHCLEDGCCMFELILMLKVRKFGMSIFNVCMPLASVPELELECACLCVSKRPYKGPGDVLEHAGVPARCVLIIPINPQLLSQHLNWAFLRILRPSVARG